MPSPPNLATRAIKPTKRELVRALVDRHRSKLQERADLRTRDRERLTGLAYQLEQQTREAIHALPLPAQAVQTAKKLQALGYTTTIDRHDDHVIVRVHSSPSIPIKLPAKIQSARQHIKDMRAKAEEARTEAAELRQQAMRDEYTTLLEVLPDSATPHLEALQEILTQTLLQIPK